MKLRAKILVFFLPLGLLSAAVILVLTRQAVRAIMTRELAERVLLKSPAAARDAREAFKSGQESKLLPLLQDMLARVGGDEAAALDLKGRVLADTNVTRKGQVYREADASKLLNARSPIYRRLPAKEVPVLRIGIPVWGQSGFQSGEEYLLSGGKVTSGAERLGTILVQISMREAQETEWLILSKVALIIFSILGVALIVAFLFLRHHILRPIRLLVEGTHLVRSGRHATVPVLTRDELGELTSSFNEMSRFLQERTRELARSNEELTQFAHLASHDLQEPLRTVSSYIQMLRQRWEGRFDEEDREFMGYIVDGARRMRELIDALLAYARVGSSKRDFELHDCGDLLRNALQNLKVALEESRARIDPGPLPALTVDPVQVAELFQNLLANAIKFRGPDPLRIQVSARREDGAWLFRVSDNGIGIDPAQSDRIFQAFQRLHSQDEYPGTGMGLAVCKKIVERHGGRIWVESEPGKGSSFYFTLEKGPPGFD